MYSFKTIEHTGRGNEYYTEIGQAYQPKAFPDGKEFIEQELQKYIQSNILSDNFGGSHDNHYLYMTVI